MLCDLKLDNCHWNFHKRVKRHYFFRWFPAVSITWKKSRKNLLFTWPLCINIEVTFSIFIDARRWLAIQVFVILNRYSILGHIFNWNSCTENLFNILQSFFVFVLFCFLFFVFVFVFCFCFVLFCFVFCFLFFVFVFCFCFLFVCLFVFHSIIRTQYKKKISLRKKIFVQGKVFHNSIILRQVAYFSPRTIFFSIQIHF